MAYGEAFSFDYDLPNDTMYTETCASVCLIFFAHRMLKIEPKGCYADVMERMRNTPDVGKGSQSILNQFQFIEICCDLTRTDLTDFFEQWGFFHVGEIAGDDYGKFRFEVTREIVDGVKAKIAAKNYPKPATDITRVEG